MILTCPECATSYFVDDARIPLTGRKVKCANCGARWTATLDPPPTDLDPDEVSPQLAAVISPEVVAEPIVEPDEASPFGDLAVAEPTATVEPALVVEPAPRRRPLPASRRAKAGPPIQLIALVALAVIALVAAALVVFRGQVMHAVPATAPAFEALGLRSGSSDLIIEGVRSQAAFQGERPVLSVTGALRNPGQKPLNAPPLRVQLLDRAGKSVALRTVTPTHAEIPAASTRYFAVIVPDPPANAASLELDFGAAKKTKATASVSRAVKDHG